MGAAGKPSTAIQPVKGTKGYRRLVQLLARVFYSGDVPPKEDEDNEMMTQAQRKFHSKVSISKRSGCICVDMACMSM